MYTTLSEETDLILVLGFVASPLVKGTFCFDGFGHLRYIGSSMYVQKNHIALALFWAALGRCRSIVYSWRNASFIGS